MAAAEDAAPNDDLFGTSLWHEVEPTPQAAATPSAGNGTHAGTSSSSTDGEWRYHAVGSGCAGADIRESVPTMAQCVYTETDGRQTLCLYGGEVDSRRFRQSDFASHVGLHDKASRFLAKHQLMTGSVYTCTLPQVPGETVEWIRRPSLPLRAKHSVVATSKDRVFAIGGYTTEQQDPAGDAQLVFPTAQIVNFAPRGRSAGEQDPNPNNRRGTGRHIRDLFPRDTPHFRTVETTGESPCPCVRPSLSFNAEHKEVYALCGKKTPDVWDPRVHERTGPRDRWAFYNLYVLSTETYVWRFLEMLNRPPIPPARIGKLAFDGESILVTSEHCQRAVGSTAGVLPDTIPSTAFMGWHTNCLRDGISAPVSHEADATVYRIKPIQQPPPRKSSPLRHYDFYTDDMSILYRDRDRSCDRRVLKQAVQADSLEKEGLRGTTLEQRQGMIYQEGVSRGTYRRLGMTRMEWKQFCLQRRLPYVPHLPMVSRGFRSGMRVVTPETIHQARAAGPSNFSALRWKAKRLGGIPHLPLLLCAHNAPECGAHPADQEAEEGETESNAALLRRTVYCLCAADSCVRLHEGPEGLRRAAERRGRRVEAESRERHRNPMGGLSLIDTDNPDFVNDAHRIDAVGSFVASHSKGDAAKRSMWYARQHNAQASAAETAEAWRCAKHDAPPPPLGPPAEDPNTAPDSSDSERSDEEAAAVRLFEHPCYHLHSVVLPVVEDEHAPVVDWGPGGVMRVAAGRGAGDFPEEDPDLQEVVLNAVRSHLERDNAKRERRKARKEKKEKKAKKSKKRKRGRRGGSDDSAFSASTTALTVMNDLDDLDLGMLEDLFNNRLQNANEDEEAENQEARDHEERLRDERREMQDSLVQRRDAERRLAKKRAKENGGFEGEADEEDMQEVVDVDAEESEVVVVDVDTEEEEEAAAPAKKRAKKGARKPAAKKAAVKKGSRKASAKSSVAKAAPKKAVVKKASAKKASAKKPAAKKASSSR